MKPSDPFEYDTPDEDSMYSPDDMAQTGEEPLTHAAANSIARNKTVWIMVRLAAAACVLLVSAMVVLLIYAGRQKKDASGTVSESAASVSAEDSDAENTVYVYDDVFATDYCYEAVQWATRTGIASGTEENLFEPETSCTRGQAVTFLYRLAGEPEPSSVSLGFTDMPEQDSPYFTPIVWAVSKGIAYGTTDSTFSPDAPVTRAQAVTFLWRMAGEPVPLTSVSPFTDVSGPDSSSYRAILWAVDNNLVSGTSDTTFEPDQECTRAQLITILYRYAGQD